MKYEFVVAVVAAVLSFAAKAEQAASKVLRAGIIGCDTSHAIAFTKTFNDPAASGDVAGVKVVAAYPGGSEDIASSRDRVAGYTKELKGMGVEIVDSIPALLEKVDVVLLESVDGRPHLEQVKPVFVAGKRVFIDKPLAGSLADAIAIYELGKKQKAVWFSSSSLRFGPSLVAAKKDAKIGEIVGAETWSPCHLEKTHPDLFWYGIHGVEALYTIMGPGCESVTRTKTETAEVVVGVWKDQRVGTFRGIHKGKEDYGAIVFGSKGIAPVLGFEGYKPLVVEIATFFKTGTAPVSNEETIEIMAFMEAADESKRKGGSPVTIESVMKKAQIEAEQKVLRSK